MDKQSFVELIDKYLNETAIGPERVLVEEYYRRLEKMNEEKLSPLEENLLKEKIYLQIVKDSSELTKHKTVKISQIAWYAVAASLIGFLAFGGINLLKKKGQEVKERASVTQITSSRQKLETIENNTGQVMQVRLSDNSLVTVYPNSSLQYLPGFGIKKRDLSLKGKAKFKVSKDPSRPFTVYAAGISTTALGTEFFITVKGNNVSVALMEGSVKVASQHKADNNEFVVLHPGDKIIVSSGQFLQYSLFHSNGKNPSNLVSRYVGKDKPEKEENKLVFKNEQMKEVLKKIEERFGVTINYQDAPGLGEKQFTGTFLEKDDLEFIMKIISDLHGLKYNIEGKHVTISMQ